MRALLDFGPLIVWSLLWISGGYLLACAIYRLRAIENAVVGIALGLVLQIWVANLAARAMPVALAFWAAAASVLLGGAAAASFLLGQRPPRSTYGQLLALAALTLLFSAIGRGLGIFDDYQNLPTLSLMAAGDVPPHFALDPSLPFGYHYLLLLFGSEVMLLGRMFPWSALDLARGLILALPLMLGAYWGYRVTSRAVVGVLTSLVLALAGGARWLLLLLPTGLVASISGHIQLIGSASTSAPNLAEAMVSSWKIDGAGPIAFPFAFYSGINQPYVMAFTGIAGSATTVLLLLLLTAGRWRHWAAGIVTLALLSALAMASEIAFLLLGLGLLVVIAASRLRPTSLESRRSVLVWAILMVCATAIAAVQGGMLTEIARGVVFPSRLASTYFDASPVPVWPPALVSAHLGSLPLLDPAALFMGLLELGPVVVVTPLVVIWACKSIRIGKAFESALIAGSLGALVAIVVAFKGPLFTATPRLMGNWFLACALYGVPLSWIWLRAKADGLKAAAIVLGLIATLGGFVLFGVELTAIQKPTYATFISPLDAKMSEDYWNQLEPGGLIFDPVVYRAPTVFGRFTRSSPSWYTRSPAWQRLADDPDPRLLRDAGFTYVYLDRDYWDGLSPTLQAAFRRPCVRQVGEVQGVHSEKDYTKDFRRLLDIRACGAP